MRNTARLPDLQRTGELLSGALLDAEHLLQAVGESERARRLGELRQAFGEPDLRVVVFGEFNRGKSTLINALLGRIVLPAKLVPTTGHVTQVVYGSSERVRVRYVDQHEEVFALDRLDSISSLDVNGVAREEVDLLEVSVPHPLLRRKIVLIDTPGLNEKEAQTRRARNAIAKADLVLLVLDARGLLNQQERHLAVDWLSEGLRKPVVLVVNFMNFLSEKDCRAVRERLIAWTQSHLDAVLGRPWFEVNARGALLHALDGEAEPADDFVRLRDALAACEGSPREALQQRSRHGQLLAELCEARAENQRVLQALLKDMAGVERERAQHQEELREQIRRFDANAVSRRDQVFLFARRSLDSHLSALIDVWLKGESKERLEAYAGVWYEAKLSEAVEEIEKQAEEVLYGLAVSGASRPAPFTIKERLILGARMEVSALPGTASDVALNTGMGIGAALGTLILPVVGTAVGAALGRWMAKHLAAPEPDYVAAYSASVWERWRTEGQKVITLLASQLDARIGELKRELVRELDSVELVTVGDERTHGEAEYRQALAEALNGCESLLHFN